MEEDGTVIPGATGTTYSVFNAATTDAGTYNVTVTGDCTPSINASAKLTITSAAKITTQPIDVSVCEGERATFTVVATGAVSYQWRKNGVNISGATNASFSISSVNPSDASSYECVVTGGCPPNETSVKAKLTVNKPAAITSDIRDLSICVGDPISLTIGVIGSGASYQWRKDGKDIVGANGPSYSIIKSAQATDAGVYDVEVTTLGCKGKLNSAKATITVNVPFSITANPSSQSVCSGSSVTFTVTTTGSNVNYQWRRNGANLSGQTGDKLIINPVKTSDGGDYDCLVSGPCKSPSASGVANLKVNAPPTVSISANGTTFVKELIQSLY